MSVVFPSIYLPLPFKLRQIFYAIICIQKKNLACAITTISIISVRKL